MRLIIFLFPIALLFGCKQAPKIPGDFDYGKVENGVYKNEFFGMEVPIPEAFIFQNKEQMDQVINDGEKILEKNNKELASKAKANRVSTAMLLILAQKKPDPVINFSFMVMAENISGLLSIKTSLDYLDRFKRNVEKTGVRCQPDFKIEEIGGKNFDMLEAINSTGERDVKLLYHVRIIKGFALLIIAAFYTEQQEEQLMDILQNMKFH